MGFENEKDHPEVAPSQFEINYGYGEVVAAADQIQLYKLICRQVATKMGMTASLPAQAGRRRQRQRHAHQRLDQPRRQEPLLGSEGRRKAQQAWLGLRRSHSHPRQRHLPAAELQRQRLPPPRSALRGAEPDQGLGRRSRLDGSHPHRQRKSMRVEVRSVAPDANPYLVLTPSSRPVSRARHPRSTTCARPSAICRTTSTRLLKTSANRLGPRSCSAKT